MKFDFTDGEWKIREHVPYFIDAKNEIIIPVARTFTMKCSDQTSEANARLISCAPEMLKFIDNLRTKVNNCGDLMKIINFIKYESDIIIEKATGKKWEDIK